MKIFAVFIVGVIIGLTPMFAILAMDAMDKISHRGAHRRGRAIADKPEVRDARALRAAAERRRGQGKMKIKEDASA